MIPAALLEDLNQRKKRLLLIAETALPASQFAAFRTLVLDELGKSGFEKALETAFAPRNGQDRAGPLKQERRCPDG